MDPVAALERIAYLLEWDLEPTYRARAFRSAAKSISGLEEQELAARAAAGTLRGLPGVGPKTAVVIAEALAGNVPAYLTTLEKGERTEVATGGAELRKALKGDCHTHSDWSDGGTPIDVMARAARGLGHDYIVLTDHSPRLTVANGLSRERLLQQLDAVAGINESMAPFRILTGIEVDILEDGSIDQDADLLERLDLVVASVHSKLRMAPKPMTERLARATANPHVDILGHCTGRLIRGRVRPPSTFDAELVFTACKEYGTALEINSRPERQDPPDDLLALAVEIGLQFSIDSDAHAPGQLEWLQLGCERAEQCGVDASSVINTKDAQELAEWTHSESRH